MKIRREIRLPGRRDFEASVFEVELTPRDIGLTEPTSIKEVRQIAHRLFAEAQISVMTHAAADGLISNQECADRIKPFTLESALWGTKNTSTATENKTTDTPKPSTTPESSPDTTSVGSGKPG